MSSFELKIDPKEAQYARLAGQVLKALRFAVRRRGEQGVPQAEIARRIAMDKGSLSRVLNGRISNLTVRTISDILWAAEHEPKEFSVDAVEDISGNYCPIHLRSIGSDKFVRASVSTDVSTSSEVRVAISSRVLERA